MQYKGDLPDHLKGVVDDNDTDRQSRSLQYDISSGHKGNSNRNHHFNENSNRNQNSGGDRIRDMAHNGNGNSKPRKGDESDGYEAIEIGRGDGKGHEHGNGNQQKHSNRRTSDFLSDNGNDQDNRERNSRSKNRDRGEGDANIKGKEDKGRGQGHGQQFTQYQNKEGRWVTEAEYEELSALCDKLMSQQDKLQDEIQLQAGLIKVSRQIDMKLDPPDVAGLPSFTFCIYHRLSSHIFIYSFIHLIAILVISLLLKLLALLSYAKDLNLVSYGMVGKISFSFITIFNKIGPTKETSDHGSESQRFYN